MAIIPIANFLIETGKEGKKGSITPLSFSGSNIQRDTKPLSSAIYAGRTGEWMKPYQPDTAYSGVWKEGYIPVPEKKAEETAAKKPLTAGDVLKYVSGITPLKKSLDLSKGIVGFGKDVAQDVARSFLSVGNFVVNFTKTPYDAEKYQKPADYLAEVAQKTYTPIGEAEKKIFGTDQPVSLETRGQELLVIGGEDFANKWGKYAIPLGVLMSGLDIVPVGWGKKEVAENAAKIISRTDDVAKIVKTLKGVVSGSDESIEFLAKSLAKVSKEDEVIKIIGQSVKGAERATSTATKTRGFIKSVSEVAPDVDLKIGGQYIPRDTDTLAIKAKNLVSDDINTAERLALTETDDKAVAVSSELIKFYNDKAVNVVDQASKLLYYDKAAEIAQATARNLTEQGRAIQAASILGRMTPEGMLRFAAKEINKYNEGIIKANKFFGKIHKQKLLPSLSAEQTKEILSEAARIEKMADGVDKAMAFRNLTNKISDLIPSTTLQKAIAVWKAGLLTGIKTSGLNTFSNLFHGVSETIKDIPAVVVDSVASLFTKKRTIGLTGFKIRQGIKEGFEKGWRYLKTGFDERNVGAKLDYHRVNFGNSKLSKAIQRYEETVFRLMGAEDQPFYYGAKARSLQSQAIAQAKNSGLKGDKAKTFIDNLVENPTDEMLKYAAGDAEMSVFQNETTLGNIARGIQRIGGGAGELVVPFGRTPAAVANQFINYTPVGIVKAIIQNVGKGRFNQRLFSQAIGRGITGSAVMAIGGALFKNNLINTDYPKTERERELWKAEGRTPNSIKIGDKWRNVNVLGPAGFVLVTGAIYQEALEETGSITQSLSQAMVGGIKSLKEQTFLQGLSQVVDALNDPERFFSGYFAGTVASVIPTIVGDFARAFDSVERKSIGLLDRFKAKLPGLRQTLEPQVDIIGRERERAGSTIETILDPSRPSEDVSNPVVKELRRLFDAGHKVTPTMLGDKNGYKILSEEGNTALWKRTGEIINSKLVSLFSREDYQNMADDLKAKNIENVVDNAHIVARMQAVIDITAGLSGEELKSKLSELKTDGIMNRDVFDKYTELGEAGVSAEIKRLEEDTTIPRITEGTKVSDSDLISAIVLYAKSIGEDPFTAFNRIFTGQKIRRIDNRTIIVERMPFEESQAVRSERGATDEMILDHTIPLQLGGSNDKDNLKLVPIDDWRSYTEIENYLGVLLRNGKITKKDAQSSIRAFKEGEITSDEIKNRYN
jgi:hypothetical protein